MIDDTPPDTTQPPHFPVFIIFLCVLYLDLLLVPFTWCWEFGTGCHNKLHCCRPPREKGIVITIYIPLSAPPWCTSPFLPSWIISLQANKNRTKCSTSAHIVHPFAWESMASVQMSHSSLVENGRWNQFQELSLPFTRYGAFQTQINTHRFLLYWH